jgi:hypothetical protein
MTNHLVFGPRFATMHRAVRTLVLAPEAACSVSIHGGITSLHGNALESAAIVGHRQ